MTGVSIVGNPMTPLGPSAGRPENAIATRKRLRVRQDQTTYIDANEHETHTTVVLAFVLREGKHD